MEPLQLFPTPPLPEESQADEQGRRNDSGPIALISAEHLEVAEAYLARDDHADKPKANIETAIFLCEGAGDPGAGTLWRLKIDRKRFPRAATAVEATREALELPPDQWPQGFWPRFLLRVLATP